MATIAPRRTISQLLRQGWSEIPEIFASSVLGVVGVALGTIGCYNYLKNDGDNRRYKKVYIIMRPDDPRVKSLRKD